MMTSCGKQWNQVIWLPLSVDRYQNDKERQFSVKTVSLMMGGQPWCQLPPGAFTEYRTM
jgi:hypothetical protein